MKSTVLVGLLSLVFAPWVVAQPIFESGFEAFPDVVLTKIAPEATNASVITYTIEYEYPAASTVPAENVVLTDAIPAGTTYVAFSATNGGIFADGTVTWNLPALDPGASGSVDFAVSVLSDGMYENTAEMTFTHVIERMVTSNTTVTHRDTVPPGVTIIGPDGAMEDGTTTYDPTPTFEYNATGDPVTFECKVDAGAYEPCPMPLGMFTTAPLSLGLHTVYVRVTDLAGNIGSAARFFTVDTLVVVILVPPTPTIINASDPNPPSFYFTTDHMGPTTFLCALDLEALAPCTSPWTPAAPLSHGLHAFFVQALDAEDNHGPIAEHNFIVDLEAPVVTVSVPPTPTVVNASDPNPPTFYFTANDPAVFYCALDLDPPTPCTSPWTPAVPPLPHGPHVFTVQAEDSAGNVGDPAMHFFEVDLEAPVAMVLVPPTPTIVTGEDPNPPTFYFTSDDPDPVTFYCALNLDPPTPCTSPWTPVVAPLPDGPHTFHVQAEDGAGNLGPIAHHEFLVDTGTS